jgi:DDE superfamily endonuclease
MLLTTWQTLAAAWQTVFAQTRTHQRALALALGLLCGVGRRTITRALGFWGKEQQDWSADYKLFSRSPWEPGALFDPWLRQGIDRYCPTGRPIAVAVDDTVVRRTGRRVPNSSWQRDPLGPPFQVNLVWGQRFLQVSLLLPLYQQDQASSPRALPVRFAECPVVRKPGKKATTKEWADYRRAKKEHSLSTRFVAVGQELRRRLDEQGYAHRELLLTGDGSFCNRTTFGARWERTRLLCRARKDSEFVLSSRRAKRPLLWPREVHPAGGL